MGNEYVWRVDGKPVEVRLNVPLAGYMVPFLDREGPENFGILLGRAKRRWGRMRVRIQDFEPFDPARFNGHPKKPADTDLDIVGLYHRREGELKLDHLDASFISSSFKNPGMVYLLISSSPDKRDRATFFIQEHGEVHGYKGYREFPFDPEFLRERAPGIAPKRSRRWIPATGLVLSLVGLGALFESMRQNDENPVPPSMVQAHTGQNDNSRPASRPYAPERRQPRAK